MLRKASSEVERPSSTSMSLYSSSSSHSMSTSSSSDRFALAAAKDASSRSFRSVSPLSLLEIFWKKGTFYKNSK